MWRSRRANPSPAKRRRKASRRSASGPPWTPWSRLARRVRQIAASLPPSQVRPFVFTELFVRVELEPRLNDLFEIVEQWAPHVVVHDVAEFAAPLVATSAGIPYVEHSYGPAIQNDVIRAAGDATAPFWTSHGLAPHPLGGLYRYLYLDVCPPSLQVPEAVPGVSAGHPYGRDSATGDPAPVAGCARRPADRLHHAGHRLQPQSRRVPGAARRPPRRSAEHRRHRGQAERPCDARSAAVERPRPPVHPAGATAPSLRRRRDARWRRLDPWCTRIRPAAPRRSPRRRSVLQRRPRRCRRRRSPTHA